VPSDPLNREFARLLKTSGWTQSEAARQLNLSPAAVSRYLSLETRPSTTVIQLFKLLVNDHAPAAPPPAQGPIVERTLTQEELDLIEDLRRLDAEASRRVISGIRAILRALE